MKTGRRVSPDGNRRAAPELTVCYNAVDSLYQNHVRQDDMATATRNGHIGLRHGSVGDEGLLEVPRDVHTLAGFRKWVLSDAFPEKLYASFLQGKVTLDFNSEEIQTHALVKTEVVLAIATLSEELEFGHIFLRGVLVTNVRAELSTNPDGVAVSWDALRSRRVSYRRWEGR